LVKILKKFATNKEIDRHLTMFFNQIKEYREVFEMEMKKKKNGK